MTQKRSKIIQERRRIREIQVYHEREMERAKQMLEKGMEKMAYSCSGTM